MMLPIFLKIFATNLVPIKRYLTDTSRISSERRQMFLERFRLLWNEASNPGMNCLAALKVSYSSLSAVISKGTFIRDTSFLRDKHVRKCKVGSLEVHTHS